jgi:hypothetical protein
MADPTFNKKEVGSLGGTAELCAEFFERFDQLVAGVDLIVLRKAADYNILAMSFIQKFVSAVLPKRWLDAMEKDSRAWRVHCKCGHGNSLWDLGGMRGKNAGKTHWRRKCEKCGQKSWQVISLESDI